ncbi:unnamed protein product [Gemmata massiliana]|uniref:Uncharacterized protein n=1 Tax=Gemmata massiliana TaxID=1210884 RepID=A0A6P2D064_9BACT|nr:hypothetical protein [Gemmata massiliana]VTR94207.1 unnamed protein product [Gemmata massiliana]
MMPHAREKITDGHRDDGRTRPFGPVPLAYSEHFTSVTIEFAESLGEPFTTYVRLQLALHEADRKLRAAQVNADVTARARAELECEERLAEVVAFEQHRANTLLMDVRFAARWYRGALMAIIDPVFRAQLDITRETVRGLEDRIDEAEDVLSDLVTGQEVSL